MLVSEPTRRYAATESEPVAKCALGIDPGIQQLETTYDLYLDGKEMHHCVGQYADACKKGTCYIYSVRTETSRSTVEIGYINDQWAIVQHQLAFNEPVKDPSAIHAIKTFVDSGNANHIKPCGEVLI